MGDEVFGRWRKSQNRSHVQYRARFFRLHKPGQRCLVRKHQRSQIQFHRFVPAFQCKFMQGTVAHFPATAASHMIQPIEIAELFYAMFNMASLTTPSAFCPRLVFASRTVSRCRPVTTTKAPSLRKAFAADKPNPVEPPIITIFLFSRCKLKSFRTFSVAIHLKRTLHRSNY